MHMVSAKISLKIPKKLSTFGTIWKPLLGVWKLQNNDHSDDTFDSNKDLYY